MISPSADTPATREYTSMLSGGAWDLCGCGIFFNSRWTLVGSADWQPQYNNTVCKRS